MIVEVSWRTLFRILAVAAFVWLLLDLVQILLVVLVSVLLAVTLEPLVRWLERRGMSRGAAATIITAGVLGLTTAFVWMTWASLVAQWRYLADYFSQLAKDVPNFLPPSMQQAVERASSDLWSTAGSYALQFAESATTAIAVVVLAFVLTIYLISDGQRTYRWVLAFVPLELRPRVERTVQESREVMVGYVVGNVITSAIATAVTFVALLALGVPAALLLALMAGLSDFVPVVGFFVSAVPAVLLGLTVSPKVCLAVIVVYIAYNTVENYVLSPWAYGRRMRLSNLAVILAFVIGAELAGVIGALVALPLAAIYPTVERLWLREQLAQETIPEHRALEADRTG